MPRQGQSVESCLIGKWHKNKGDKVSIGDVLFTYETDKAAFEEVSKVEGVLLDVFFEEGEYVECLMSVCVIGTEGESVEQFKPTTGSATVSVASSDADPAADSVPLNSVLKPMSTDTNGAVMPVSRENDAVLPQLSVLPEDFRISPRAKRLAEKTLADLSYAKPTGVNGRIIERDVQIVLSQGHRLRDGGESLVSSSDSNDVEVVALTNVRKFIAKAMHKSLSESAQLTNHSSFDATDIQNFRKNLKVMEGNEILKKITVTDIIIYAVSRVILNHKNLNAHFLGDSMAIFNNANIGVAVDTPRGLLVPTIFNANTLSLTDISVQAKALFEKCRQGSIEPDLLKGASFTISNLGGLGVEMFTPILNPPQTGILGVCSIIERTRDSKPYPAMGLSLTYDHRAVDGADAARFSKELALYLEKFSFSLALEVIEG